MSNAQKARPLEIATPEPFDLDAAAQSEAIGSPTEFTLGGELFTLPASTDWPVEVSAVLTSGDLVGAMGMLLGDQQEAFMAHKPTMGHVRALMKHAAKTQGLSLGE